MNSKSLVNNFVASNNFLMVNKNMIRMLSGDCNSAIMLAHLMSLSNYFEEQGTLDQGWFYQKVEDIENVLGINPYFQSKAIYNLKSLGFLNTELRHSPPNRFFNLNYDLIWSALVQECPEGIKKTIKSKDKASFYSALNGNKDWDKLEETGGNIPLPILEFMFVFKEYIPFPGWNPQSYGMLSTYFKKTYLARKRAFEYRKLLWWKSKQNSLELTLKNFIEFDQLQYEVPPGLRALTAKEFYKEYVIR